MDLFTVSVSILSIRRVQLFHEYCISQMTRPFESSRKFRAEVARTHVVLID